MDSGAYVSGSMFLSRVTRIIFYELYEGGTLNMKVENNEIILTNREYFTKFCVFHGNDLCQIWRMWLKHLDKTIGRDAPMWEKEAQYEAFMDAEFSKTEWDAAKLKKETRPSSPLLTKIQRRVMAVE